MARNPAGFAGLTQILRSMKLNTLLRLVLAPLSAGAFVTGLSAQTAPASVSVETIKLTPFAVTAEKSAGY